MPDYYKQIDEQEAKRFPELAKMKVADIRELQHAQLTESCEQYGLPMVPAAPAADAGEAELQVYRESMEKWQKSAIEKYNQVLINE